MAAERKLRAGVGLGLLVLAAVGCTPFTPPPDTATTAKEEVPPPRRVEFLVFSAKWCGVCRDVPPVLKKLRANFPEVSVRELDVDEPENGKLAAEYDADALPYYFIRIDGRVVDRRRGFLPYDNAEAFLRGALDDTKSTKGQ